MQKTKTNLFVVGAMKAGTTSFIDLLSQHPEIYAPPVKEPHYFVDQLPLSLYDPGRFFNLNDYLEKEFPKPLHITKIETSGQYKKIYAHCGTETINWTLVRPIYILPKLQSVFMNTTPAQRLSFYCVTLYKGPFHTLKWTREKDA